MTMPDYPLMDNAEDRLRAFSGRPLADIQLETSDLSADDLRAHADTLRLQAEIALNAGYDQLAANFMRAAELTNVPNGEVLQIYDLLRPGRASYDQLLALAAHLEQTYGAAENARFVREAAAVYRKRRLLRE